MSSIDRYVFGEWLKAFLLSLGATLGLLVIYDMYDNLGDLLEFNATTSQILKYYANLVPALLPTILPVAFLVSLLFSLGNLHRNNEIVAMRACGLSFWRITRALWGTGMVLSVFMLFLNAKVVPWSVEQSRALWDSLEYHHEAEVSAANEVGIIHTVAFDNPIDNRLWFMNRFNKYSYRGYGVTISFLNDHRQVVSKWLARECYFDHYDKSWVFSNGRENSFDPDTGELIRSKPFDEKVVDDFSESPNLMLILEKRPKDLSLFELETLVDYYSRLDSPKLPAFQVKYHGIMAGTAICLIVVGLAIPFSVKGVRVNAMVGVSKATGLFMAYYFISNLSGLFGDQGYVAPVIAAWVPNILMGGYAGFLSWRLR